MFSKNTEEASGKFLIDDIEVEIRVEKI